VFSKQVFFKLWSADQDIYISKIFGKGPQERSDAIH